MVSGSLLGLDNADWFVWVGSGSSVMGEGDGIGGAASPFGNAMASQELEQYVRVTFPMEICRPLYCQK